MGENLFPLFRSNFVPLILALNFSCTGCQTLLGPGVEPRPVQHESNLGLAVGLPRQGLDFRSCLLLLGVGLLGHGRHLIIDLHVPVSFRQVKNVSYAPFFLRL